MPPTSTACASEALFTAYRDEQRKLDALIAASHAKSPATDARLAELKELQDTAHRRWTDATDALAAARTGGDVAEIAAAREEADEAYAAFDATADECITEALKINGERSDELGKVLEQMKLKENAYPAWLAAVRTPAPTQ
ncbi:hypothetical protein C8D87_114152 [Lentzea atacamensis]|uniref:Uncharacterized protein n=1 Tax=Lentzea atacamensis TaxID=531938 RepID=A0ABX9DZ89_9PSEU|nr:hypothetical protein [Lentzea atacamensis]RAS59540.1 hypothetical protein C8D87_114152 [Lentzea atacamensis]